MADVARAAQLCILLLLAMLQCSYTKLADGSSCTNNDQCDGGYCATKRIRAGLERVLCCSRQYGENCSASCTWQIKYTNSPCDPCCGRLVCNHGFCGMTSHAVANYLTNWSEWTYTWSTGGVNTKLQVCSDERIQHRYRNAPDFYPFPTIEFKPLHSTHNCDINLKCHKPVCTKTVSVPGTTLHYLGCFYSERHFFDIMVQINPVDPDICFTLCSNYFGIRYYGLYHNNFCGCAYQIYSTKFGPIYQDERKCTEKCVGNSRQFCGGLDAANMYCMRA